MPAAIVASLGVTGFAATVLTFVVNMALSAIFQSLLAPDEPEAPDRDGPLVNKRSNTASIPVVYGERRIGGNRVFVASSGDKNKFIHMALLICEGEIEGFTEIYLDDNKLRFEDKPDVFLENTVYTPIGAVERDELGADEDTEKYLNLVEVTFHHGSDTQDADDDLIGISTWSANHKLQGRAYIRLRFEYDQDVFSSIPNVTSDVRGKKVAPILGVDIDDTPANAAFSSNPALCLRDYLTNDDYGRGLPTSSIDDAKVVEAANYCDATITLLDEGGATISSGPRYTVNGVLQTSNTLYDNTEKMLTHMRGFLVFSSGIYKLLLDKVETSEVLYDENNIIGKLSLGLGTKKNTLNTLRATFWNPDKNGENDTIIIDSPTVRSTLDNGLTLSKELQLDLCNSPHVARYLGNQELEQSRQQLHVNFKVGIAGLRNEIGDIIRIRHASMGWGYQVVTVDGASTLIPNEVITIDNIGQTGLVTNWNITTPYEVNDSVTFGGVVYVADNAGFDPDVGIDPATNTTDWSQASLLTDIPNISQFGIILDGGGNVVNNIGVDGNFLYKEFRILAISLMEGDEVELSAIEYDATVYDNEPLGVIDATPNTSFSNPNTIPAVDGGTITFKEALYVTSTSGGVKSSIIFGWEQPNSIFVKSYDIFVHRPEEDWDDRDDFAIGDKVTHNGTRWVADRVSGPTSNEVAIVITGTPQTILDGVLVQDPSDNNFYRAVLDQTGVDTSEVFTNLLNWNPDDGSGAVTPTANTPYWTGLTVVADEDYLFQVTTTSREFTLLDSKPGTHDIRIRANSVTGTRGATGERLGITVLGLIRPPNNIENFGLVVEGTLALLTWNPPTDLDVRIGGSIQVRHNPGITDSVAFAAADLDDLWSNSAVLTEGKSGVTSQILTSLLQGVYMIKPIDASGIESANPVAILNEVGNVVELFDITSINEHFAWDGVPVGDDADTIAGNDSSGVERVAVSTTDAWDNGTVYSAGVYVNFGGAVYESIDTSVLGEDPTVDPLDWSLLTAASDSTNELPLRLKTLQTWSPTAPYAIGDKVEYSGSTGTFVYEAVNTIAEATGGSTNETPEGETISLWGLISSRAAISSGDWTLSTADGLTPLDIPAVSSGVYYFDNEVIFNNVEQQDLEPTIVFTSQQISQTIDNFGDPIDDMTDLIDDLGDANASTGTSVKMEISTTNDLTVPSSSIPDAAWSSYSTFTGGSYNFRGARFRISIVTTVTGTQVNITEAGILTQLAARTISNITDLSWTNAIATGAGFVDVLYETASGAGSSFHGGGGGSISGASDPTVALILENIFPGEYFIITNDDGVVPDSIPNGIEAAAPTPPLGFRIRFYQVGSQVVCTNATCTTTATVLGVPAPATDGLLLGKTITFDYQATGY